MKETHAGDGVEDFHLIDRVEEEEIESICVKHEGSIEAYLFEYDGEELLLQGSLNSGDVRDYTDVPDGARKFAEDHYNANLVGNTDE